MSTNESLARTPLYNLHVELGAKMVPFAGYEMPVQYPKGIIQEHNHTRTQAGLFDVSHMGQVRLSGPDAAAALETLVPVDIVDLPAGSQRYALFTNEQGGILDDLMVANSGDSLFVVVNAACKQQDIAHMQARLSNRCQVEELADRALLAIQGPAAAAVMTRLAPETGKMIFMAHGSVTLVGAPCFISRSGYTGEDGYEISVPADKAMELARLLLAQPEVAPIGLGARDSLRLEAGLCLYGHDIDTTTTPVEANLSWAIQKPRRRGGAREGGFPGAGRILRELAEGPARLRVGLRPEGRAPMREGTEFYATAEGGVPIGRVTSGGFGPSIEAPMAMAYLPATLKAGDTVYGDVRGKRMPATIVALPFQPTNYKR